MREDTKKRYVDFINHLASRVQGFRWSIYQNFKVSTNILSILRDWGFIKKEGGLWRWVGSKEDLDSLAVRIGEKSNSLARAAASKRKKPTPTTLDGKSSITDSQAIAVLKSSERYDYEIYRIEKVKM